MKKALLATALGTAALLSSLSAQAATATGNFNVVINLTPTCLLVVPTGAVTLNYMSFQGTAVTGSKPFTLQCTSGLAYGIALSPPFTAPVTGLTVIETLSTAALVGSGNVENLSVGYSIAASQSGTCTNAQTTANPCTDTVPRTITVTY